MKLVKFVLVFLLLLFPFASSLRIEMVDYPETVYTLEKTTVKFKIINDDGQRDTFYIGIWPSSWISLEKYFVSLDPNEEEIIKFVIEPPIDADVGNVVFSIKAKSTQTTKIASLDIILNIRRRTGTYFSDLTLNQDVFSPKETLIIKPMLVNLDKTQGKHVMVKTKILKDEEQIAVLDEELILQPLTTKTLSIPFEIKNTYEPGLYKVQVFMYDEFGNPIHSKSSFFTIKKYSEIEKEKKIHKTLLEVTFTINVTNKGNYPQNIIITETMPKFSKYFFYPEIEPEKSEEKENRITYTWSFSDVKPNQSVNLQYSLRFGSAAFVIFLFLLFMTFILSLLHKPTLMKKYSEKLDLEKENLVTLHIKNNSLREIDNVVVKDIVPPVFIVVKEFDTLKPEIKVTPKGTNLIWRIDKLKPKEDRVLSYRIKPTMNIDGKVRLPKAYFSYKSGKSVINKIAEKIVTFSKRVK
ncbi:MAG: hypothetical protein QXO84_00960 [Candidatus Aenigmatarchaeota archaeon]